MGDEFFQVVDSLLSELGEDEDERYEALVKLAESADYIRGYDDVKEAGIATWRSQVQATMQQWSNGFESTPRANLIG
jgi:hypothetical protein